LLGTVFPGGTGEFPDGTGDGESGGAGAAATCFLAATSSETRNRRGREALSDGVTFAGVGDVGRVDGVCG
jgi:hypothetical protein